MLEWLQRLTKRLPRPLQLAVLYCVGFWGIFQETIYVLRFATDIPLSMESALRYGYWTCCAVHFVTLQGIGRLNARGRVRAWLGWIGEPIAGTVVAVLIGGAVAGGVWVSRGGVRPVSDEELHRLVETQSEALERRVVDSVRRKAEASGSQLDLITDLVAGRTLAAAVELLNGGTTASSGSARPNLIVVWPGQPNAPVYTVPKLARVPDWLEQLARRDAAAADGWLTWTPLGYMVVRNRHLQGGNVVVATPWGEGTFVRATRELWAADGKQQVGLSLLDADGTVRYSTEVSDYGEALQGVRDSTVERGRLVEVASGRRTNYVYDRTPLQPELTDVVLRVSTEELPVRVLTLVTRLVIIVLVCLLVVTVYLLDESGQLRAARGRGGRHGG
jgi:hypothetical protein